MEKKSSLPPFVKFMMGLEQQDLV
jgi:hypothetical protein